jgi:hypothetical protein
MRRVQAFKAVSLAYQIVPAPGVHILRLPAAPSKYPLHRVAKYTNARASTV